MERGVIQLKDALQFVVGGNAYFILKSKRTGVELSYHIYPPKSHDKEKPGVLWVNVLVTSSTHSEYKYIGFMKVLEGKWEYYYSFRTEAVLATATSVAAFKWFMKLLYSGNYSNNLEIFHQGRCCRCGRELTTPQSILSGIGPRCNKIKKTNTK